MSLLLGQLVYTSFPRVGFRTLASAQVPREIHQAFIQQIVYQYWNSYNPPGLGYRAAYLHQVSQEETLFGWLYNDGLDDLGRNHVPYFVCYYLAEPLHPVLLEYVLTCLHRGPVASIDRQRLPATSETIVTSNWWSYQPARMGVAIPSEVGDRSHAELKQGKLLDLFIPVDERKNGIELNGQTYNQQKATLPTDTCHLVIEGIEADVIDLKESAAKAGALKSQDEYQKILQLYAQALGDLPSTGTTAIGLKKKALTALIPSYRSFRLLVGIGIAATLALAATMYELHWQQQGPQLLQTTNTLETGASWQNVRAETLSGHSGAVWSVAISSDGQTLASGSSDHTIKIWNLSSGELLHTFEGHGDRVISVAISPDGKILASGSVDKTVKIWHLGSRKLLRTLSGHLDWVNSVAISPDRQILASGIGDITKVWDLDTGELLYTLPGHSSDITSVFFSPSGKQFASGSQDKTINIWRR